MIELKVNGQKAVISQEFPLVPQVYDVSYENKQGDIESLTVRECEIKGLAQ